MEIRKVKNYDEMSKLAAERMAEKLKHIEKPILGLATGSTPEGLYKCLIEKYEQKEISFQQVTTFNLDEYVGISKDDPNSYHYFMAEKLFNHVDIVPDHTHVPSGEVSNAVEECENYEKKIRDAGGIDMQILGIGLNGHIGFNEPGTSFESRTHVIDLDESTRQANSRFFSSIDEVPKQAITMGIATIMESKEILLLVSGEAKADILAKVINGDVTEEIPATILQQHPNVTIIADEAALSKA